VRVSLVATERDLAAAMAVRSVVWLADPEQTFNVQFDPNVFGSSHVLAWVGDEPVGTLRIRWFAGFARFERMAIRPQFRSFKVFRALVGFSLDLCAAKGYAHVVGVSRPPGVSFWKRCGGEVIGDGPIIYNGMEVYPMRMMLKKGVDERLASGIAGVGGSAFEAAIAVAEGELVASAPVPSKATQADDGIKRDREAA
jgi:GNAT superfamily N-acetyltransferase